MYVLQFSFILKHLSNVCFVDFFHFEAVLKERKLKNVHSVVSQRVHDGKKTVKCIFAFSKIKISSKKWRKNPQINCRMRGGGAKYQPQRIGVRRLWGRRLRGFTVLE